VELLGERLGDVADAEVVVGEPMTLGQFTLVPLTRLSVGIGGGGGKGEGEAQSRQRRHHEHAKGKGVGVGSGGGAKVRPVAMLAFGTKGVEVLAVPDKKGKLDKLMEKIPGWIERFAGDDEG
jgi:uncharacterized spore protein YtfJ